MYSISYDADRVLLTVVQNGYWTMPVFRSFEQTFVQHHTQIRTKAKCYRVLADCRNFAVQSTELGDAFGAFYAKILSQNKGHFAVVTTSMLSKMQAKRALPQPHVQVFDEWDDAMQWLFIDGSLTD
jgi:hypothetical protein